MFQELVHAARDFAGLAIVLFVAVAAAAVTGLTLVGGGVSPRVAAAAALVTPLVCGLALGAAAHGSRVGLASVAATLAVAHALVHGG